MFAVLRVISVVITGKRARFVGVAAVFLVAVLALGVTATGSSNTKPDKKQASSTSESDDLTDTSEPPAQAVYDASDKTSNTSNVDVRLKTNQHSNNGSNSSHTSLTVNGQDVPVDSGNVNYSHRSSSGDTTVDVSVQSNSSSTGNSSGGSM